MYSHPIAFLRIFSVLLLLPFHLINAAGIPVNFCKEDVAQDINFCFAVSSWLNTTTSALDLYVTIIAEHLNSSPSGWVGVALGPSMRGALMFIVYGDPNDANNKATTIVRTALGHRHPVALTGMSPKEMIPDIEVKKSTFVPFEDSDSTLGPARILTSEIVCYNCSAWVGTKVDLNSVIQPFIWAVNPHQDFQGDFSEDAALEMHRAERGRGTGKIWVDLSSAFQDFTNVPPPFPTISHSYSFPVGATENLDDARKKLDDAGKKAANKAAKTSNIHNWLWHLHGLLLTVAFLLLYPLGAYLLQAAHSRAFMLHWITQVCASGLVGVGVGVGVIQSRRIGFFHQFLGLSVAAVLVVQGILGWRAHVGFLAMKQKNWLGMVHRWLGISVLGAGCVNVVLGLRWRHYSRLVILAVVVVIIFEVVGMAWIAVGRWRRRGDSGSDPVRREGAEEYAMLGADDTDEEEDAGGEDVLRK